MFLPTQKSHIATIDFHQLIHNGHLPRHPNRNPMQVSQGQLDQLPPALFALLLRALQLNQFPLKAPNDSQAVASRFCIAAPDLIFRERDCIVEDKRI
jgi:hypothetical protein